MVRTSRKLPKEWHKYQPIGNVVANTRIFAFKTPLRYHLVRKYSKEQRFTVPDLYRTLLFQGMPLGLVINATNTDRYYDSREIANLGVEYRKLPNSGRSFVECEGLVKQFIKTVDDFLERNADNNLLIGVHCTDGVNRSGYLICRYLIERHGMTSNDALNAFEAARGYTIERGALVLALNRADHSRKMRSNRHIESEEEEDLTDRDRRKRKRRHKETVDDSFDPHMIQEIQSLVQTIKQMQNEPAPAANVSYGAQDFGQAPMNNSSMLTANNSSSYPGVYSNNHTPQAQQHPAHNLSETSSPYVDSQDFDDDDDDEDTGPIDLEMLGKIDVKELTAAQRRRMRRKHLKKQFDVMKRGKFWEINEFRGK